MQLTVRFEDRELERRLRELATAEGISLNAAVLRVLRTGAGIASSRGPDRRIGSRLDHLAGTWTRREARSIEQALGIFERIEDEVWR